MPPAIKWWGFPTPCSPASAASGRAAVVATGGIGEHRVDRRRNKLDVPELLGGDAAEQVVEGPRALPGAEVERLERVVQPCGHLSELAAQELLHHRSPGRIGFRWRRQICLKPIDAQNHGPLLALMNKDPGGTPGLRRETACAPLRLHAGESVSGAASGTTGQAAVACGRGESRRRFGVNRGW
jgi:hypothetical protein